MSWLTAIGASMCDSTVVAVEFGGGGTGGGGGDEMKTCSGGMTIWSPLDPPEPPPVSDAANVRLK